MDASPGPAMTKSALTQAIQLPSQPKLARETALRLAAGGSRNDARRSQHHLLDCELVPIEYCVTDAADNVGHLDPVAIGALDLVNDGNGLATTLVLDRERSAAVAA